MPSASYEVTVHADASPERCYALIADATAWPRWAPGIIAESSWEREGDPPPGGVGAIRKVGRWPLFGREEVVVADPAGHHGYTLLSGQPVRNYRADVIFAADGAGTRITWRGSFDPKIPGTGAMLAAFFRGLMRRFATSLANYAAAHPE